tara:strand:- start:375 stop:1742 length:1368 start_codon:yes stop_codon:yes gene_type:complete
MNNVLDKNKYSLFLLEPNYLAIENKSNLINEQLLKSDIFIYQPIDDKYNEQSSKYIISNLKDSVMLISLPYCYSKMYFIQNTDRKAWNSQLNTYNDAFIEKEISLNNNFNIIFNKLIKEDYVEKEKIVKEFNNTNAVMNSKEIDRGTKDKDCDIKMVDFILNNYQDKCLFNEMHHPSNFIYEYIVNKILEKLQIDKKISFPPSIQSPLLPQIYPCVYKHLNLKFSYDEQIFKKYCEYQYIHNKGEMLIMNYSVGRSGSTKLNNVLKHIIEGFNNILLYKSHLNKDVHYKIKNNNVLFTKHYDNELDPNKFQKVIIPTRDKFKNLCSLIRTQQQKSTYEEIDDSKYSDKYLQDKLNEISVFNTRYKNYDNVLYLDYDTEIDNLDIDKILNFLSIKIDNTKKQEIINIFKDQTEKIVKNQDPNDKFDTWDDETGIHGQHITLDTLEESKIYKRLIKL